MQPPTISGYKIIGAYIKKFYLFNSNQAFECGTFNILQSGGAYYVYSDDCEWHAGGTRVDVTMTFIYQK